MDATFHTTARHRGEMELLTLAVGGDQAAVNKVLHYLSSLNPDLRQLMLEAIQDSSDPALWQHLLFCLATQRWNDHQDCDRRLDASASHRIDQSIVRVFTQDEPGTNRLVKEQVLHEALEADQTEVRFAAAYLLGLRQDTRQIPALRAMIQSGQRKWQVRAIRALGMMGDDRCGPVLVEALCLDRGLLHTEARRALWRLGQHSVEAYRAALHHPDPHIRWHAARGLGEAGDVRAVSLLAEGLLDETEAVRWASARVLAQLGSPAVPAILSVLGAQPLHEPLRQAAYYALHALTTHQSHPRLDPLLAALHSATTAFQAPAIARHLLSEWEQIS